MSLKGCFLKLSVYQKGCSFRYPYLLLISLAFVCPSPPPVHFHSHSFSIELLNRQGSGAINCIAINCIDSIIILHMRNKITILDGGIGHELKLRGVCSDGTFVAGLRANENKDINNVVESIHVDYLAAGCDVITTNSFVAVSNRSFIESSIF